jgi:hypothetical protein
MIAASAIGGVPPYAYMWSPSGGTNAIATGIGTGCYTVTIFDAGGCVFTQSTCISVTGLDERNASMLRIFPNPAKAEFTIEVDRDCVYSLYNHLGQLITSGECVTGLNKINAEKLAKGIYHLNIVGEELRASRKIVIGD